MRAPCSRALRALHAPVLVALLMLGSGVARAQPAGDPKSDARAAYARAAKAYDSGQYASAAVDFAFADEKAPNPVALQLAIESAILADDPVLGMTLADRADARKDPESTQASAKAREKFASRAGRLSVTCPGRASCRATIDGASATMGVARWIKPGDHPVEIFIEGSVERQIAHVAAGAVVEVSPTSPLPTPPVVAPPSSPKAITLGGSQPSSAPRSTKPLGATEDASASSGLSPAWFVVGLSVTAVLGGVTIGSGVDTTGKRADFVASPTDQTEAVGRSAATRTNILLAATGGAALITGLVGVFGVRWSSGEKGRTALSIAPSAEGARAHLMGEF